jgi:tetratricopeptide (TPR) repeat protein
MRFGILAAVVLAALLIGCGGAQARKNGYMTKGREYFAAQNYEKARLEFRNALQLDPNDAEASFLAGEAAERLGNLREAAQMYHTAIQANGKHLGARAHLARLYVLTGSPDKAVELVEPGLAIAPDDADLLAARGAARERLGDKPSARADAEKAVRIAPANENAVVLLASIESQAGETDKAINLVKNAVQASAASVDLRIVLAQLYLNAGRHPEVVQELERVISIEPKKFVHRYRLAQVLLLDKNVDGAEAALRAGVAQVPDSADAKLALANFLASYRTYDVAEAELRRMSAASPNDYQLRLGLGQFYASHNKAPQAEAVYRQIIKDDGTGPNGLIARNRLASAYLAANQPDAAAALVAEVLKQNPRDNDALITRSNLSLTRGKADAAIADLRAVQRDQPNSIPLQRALARAYLKNDDPTLAEETLRAAVQASPNDPNARLDLAQLLVRMGQPDQALPMLEKLATDQPANAAVLEAFFDVQIARKDFAGARRTAALVQTAKPELPAGNYMSGLAELADGKPDAARAAFERAAAISPSAVEPVTALVRLDLSQQHQDAALARLDKVIAQFPKNPLARNLKGEVLAQLKRTDPAIASFREAIALTPAWITPYRNIATAEFAAGRNDEAIKALQEGVKASRDAPELVADLAGLYERTGRVNDAVAQYEVFLKHDADSTVGANNLAMLLVTYRTDKASLDRARALSERFASSRDPVLIDTWGWVLYKRGENVDALAVLQKAVDKSPKSPVLLYHLAMAQLKSGARDSARSSLEQALKPGAAFAGSDEAKKTLDGLKL